MEIDTPVLVAIVLGALAGVILLVGIIVCIVRCTRQRKMKKDNPYNKGSGNEYQHAGSVLPLPQKTSPVGEPEVVPIRVPMVDPPLPTTVTGNAAPAVTRIGQLQNGTEPAGVQTIPSSGPIIMNPANLAMNNGDSRMDRIQLNQQAQPVPNQPPAPVASNQVAGSVGGFPLQNGSVTVGASSAQPFSSSLGVASYSDVLPAQREILNGAATPVVPPGPIIPQQAQLFYPFMPRSVPSQLYPTLPVPAPPTMLPAASQIATLPQALPNTVYTTYASPGVPAAANPMLPNTINTRIPNSGQVQTDGFTVYPSNTTASNNTGSN